MLFKAWSPELSGHSPRSARSGTGRGAPLRVQGRPEKARQRFGLAINPELLEAAMTYRAQQNQYGSILYTRTGGDLHLFVPGDFTGRRGLANLFDERL